MMISPATKKNINVKEKSRLKGKRRDRKEEGEKGNLESKKREDMIGINSQLGLQLGQESIYIHSITTDSPFYPLLLISNPRMRQETHQRLPQRYR